MSTPNTKTSLGLRLSVSVMLKRLITVAILAGLSLLLIRLVHQIPQWQWKAQWAEAIERSVAFIPAKDKVLLENAPKQVPREKDQVDVDFNGFLYRGLELPKDLQDLIVLSRSPNRPPDFKGGFAPTSSAYLFHGEIKTASGQSRLAIVGIDSIHVSTNKNHAPVDVLLSFSIVLLRADKLNSYNVAHDFVMLKLPVDEDITTKLHIIWGGRNAKNDPVLSAVLGSSFRQIKCSLIDIDPTTSRSGDSVELQLLTLPLILPDN